MFLTLFEVMYPNEFLDFLEGFDADNVLDAAGIGAGSIVVDAQNFFQKTAEQTMAFINRFCLLAAFRSHQGLLLIKWPSNIVE